MYCQHILDGNLPRAIPDTRAVPLAMSMEITHEVPIGCHVGIPIRRGDGSVYGMFCALSREPMPSLNERDVEVAEMFAELIADHVDRTMSAQEVRAAIATRLRRTIDDGHLSAVFQPIVDLGAGNATGFEALSRFPGHPDLAPVTWFDDADEVGLTVELEMAAIHSALGALRVLPDDVHLSLNVSPATIVSGRLAEAFQGIPLRRIVLEVTEHSEISDYAHVLGMLAPLRSNGASLAVDDSGAGSAGLRQLVKLAPDIVKLDRSLTTGIASDPAKRALVAAMVHFARETGAEVTAEGIETETELDVVRGLGVHRVQGWYIGRPASLDATVARLRSSGPLLPRA